MTHLQPERGQPDQGDPPPASTADSHVGDHSHGSDRHISGRDHDHEDGEGHGHGNGHGNGADGHDHEHTTGLKGFILSIFRPHSHDSADSVDSALEGSAEGIRAVKISLAALGVTAIAQLIVVLITGSVALLAGVENHERAVGVGADPARLLALSLNR